jgi:hypothetical protein
MQSTKPRRSDSMKYYLLNNSIVVFVDNNVHTISNNDYRFEQVKAAIAGNNLDFVRSLIDPNYSLNKDGFIVRNGIVFYQDSPIPTVLGNRFMGMSQDSFEFRSIFNFWFNMKTRVDDAAASNIIDELVHRNAYAVTEDGFYLLYNNKEIDQTNSALNKRNQDEVFHFYNYATCPAKYFTMFDAQRSLSSVLEEVFGFCTKKLRNLAVQNVFGNKDNFFNYKWLFYGEAFKDILATDNILYAIEHNLLDTKLGDIDNYQDLRVFLKDYSVEKNGTYSQRKIINFLESVTDKHHLVEIGTFYTAVKHQFNIDIQGLNFVNNCETIHAYLQREYGRIQNPIFMLNNDPEIEALDEVEFANFRIMVPKTNHDLIAWGGIMHHCVGGKDYAEGVKKKDRQIISINDKTTNEMLYTLDIRRKSLVQCLGKFNKAPSTEDRNIIVEFLRDKNLIYKE